jgi:phosphoglycerate kinase
MEKELKAIDQVLVDPARPCAFVLGGVKVEDRIPAIKMVLGEGIADRVLVGGLVRETFHMAEKHPREEVEALPEAERALVEEAGALLKEYGDRIETPVDVALDVGGERVEIHVDNVTNERNIFDIGLNTMARFCDLIKTAGTVVAEGPMGMFERRNFNTGSKEILRAMAECEGFTLLGGGHLGGLAAMMDLNSRMGHVSTGGGAMLTMVTGGSMPVVHSLERSKRRHG